MTTKRKAAKSSKSSPRRKTPAKLASTAFALATNSDKTPKQRIAAMSEASQAVIDNDQNLQAVLSVLRNQAEPVPVRLAALQSLQAAAFSVISFESCRADYIATLRKIATDPDPEIRQRALAILSREKDGFAQKKLIEGLQNPDKALVSPEKALQLLGNDVHAEAYSIAREVVKNPPNEMAKQEALRLLAADAKSAPIFEKLLRDKDETREVREISAAALQAINPQKFQAEARKIVLDKSDHDDIQATSLTALARSADDTEAPVVDDKLFKEAERLHSTGSAHVKKSARHYLSKFKR
jgi:hypothetical protein